MALKCIIYAVEVGFKKKEVKILNSLVKTKYSTKNSQNKVETLFFTEFQKWMKKKCIGIAQSNYNRVCFDETRTEKIFSIKTKIHQTNNNKKFQEEKKEKPTQITIQVFKLND